MATRVSLHPEHSAEQAYIEHVHEVDERNRENATRRAESGADRYTARVLRDKALKRLSESVDLDALCFGRIDLDDGSRYYIGRDGVRDDDNRLLVVNWRTPVARAFYTARREDPEGLRLRRRFQLDHLRLLGIVDDVFTNSVGAEGLEQDAAAADPVTQPPEHLVDAILAEMERARGPEMRDIVASIEARQYELITDPIEDLLVIQGGPGSGKTAIALHRAAWLLYNHREELGRTGVLVVGPNRAFMEYVAGVLPSLGESAVVQVAVDRLPDLGDVRVRGVEGDDAARLKGDIRMVEAMRRAVRDRVRPASDDVLVTVGRSQLLLAREDINAAIEEAWGTDRTYLSAREQVRERLVSLADAAAEAQRRPFRSGPSGPEIRMAVAGPGGLADRTWPTTTAPEVLRDLLNSRRRLETAGGELFSASELELLQRPRERSIREEPWTSSDIPLLDEIDTLLRGIVSSFGYVLADEAQDLSPMQLRMVLRRSTSGRATLVGDLAQATGPSRHRSWGDLVGQVVTDPSRVRTAELMIGYRVPRQIVELAAQVLPRIASDISAPRAVRVGPEDPRMLRVPRGDAMMTALVAEVQARSETDRSVAVIAAPNELGAVRASLSAAGIDSGDILADGLTRPVTVLSASQAKGLEFDHVVVIEPTGVAGDTDVWALVYVALTRATRTLTVLHSTTRPFERDSTPTANSDAVKAPPVDGVPSGHIAAPMLGARYTEALLQAKFLHAGQVRRGSRVPYLAHLQSVASLVLEDGGTEDEAIAALLHDAVEDHGVEVLDRIAAQFGTTVASIVAGCTDPPDGPDESWRARKRAHLRDLEGAGAQVRRVALAEKLDNARSLLRDYRHLGDRIWGQMDVQAEDLLWYVSELADLFVTERPGDLAWELRRAVDDLLDLASSPVEAP